MHAVYLKGIFTARSQITRQFSAPVAANFLPVLYLLPGSFAIPPIEQNGFPGR